MIGGFKTSTGLHDLKESCKFVYSLSNHEPIIGLEVVNFGSAVESAAQIMTRGLCKCFVPTQKFSPFDSFVATIDRKEVLPATWSASIRQFLY
ncbi:hypothetical protein Tco_1365466 [Tanacetum coccineum]